MKQQPLPEQAPKLEYCTRSQQPIAQALSDILPKRSFVLEIGSGIGQHGAYISQHLPSLTWQPSEMAENLASIELWRQQIQCKNFLPPLTLDVNQALWPVEQAGAVFTANTVHFVSWRTVQNMFAGVAQVLTAGGLFIIYGPFNYLSAEAIDGIYQSEGNKSLDAWLKGNNPEAGIKGFAQILTLARSHGFELQEDRDMPANNHILVFRMKHKSSSRWLDKLKAPLKLIRPIPLKFKRKP